MSGFVDTQLITGNLWDEVGVADLILFTANASKNAKGELVMGAGAALEAKTRFPELPGYFGSQIRRSGDRYGLLFCRLEQATIGAFQVKYRWNQNADLDLIRYSTEKLTRLAVKNPNRRIVMNYPGIGCGRLLAQQVEPIIEMLPGNVLVYRKDD